MNVHCRTVYNSKDLEPTQFPIDGRLKRENMAHIYHEILCSQKRWVPVLCRDMYEPGNHHSQQTDIRTENQTPHILTHRWVLNNENTWTQGGEYHILGSVGAKMRGTAAGGELGRDNMAEMPDIGEGEKGSKPHATCVPMQLSCMFFTCTPKPKMQ